MMTSQVIQVRWLFGQLINSNNLHVSQNLTLFRLGFLRVVQLGGGGGGVAESARGL